MHMCIHLFSHNVIREAGTLCSLTHYSIMMQPFSKTFYVLLIGIRKYSPFGHLLPFSREAQYTDGRKQGKRDMEQWFLAAHEPGAPHQQN